MMDQYDEQKMAIREKDDLIECLNAQIQDQTMRIEQLEEQQIIQNDMLRELEHQKHIEDQIQQQEYQNEIEIFKQEQRQNQI